MARRARPRIIGKVYEKSSVYIAASHDGYRRLNGKNEHVRSWSVVPGRIDIEDRLEGAFNSAEARFYLHPDVSVKEFSRDDSRMILLLPQGGELIFEVKGGSIRIEPSTWHPGFGISLSNACIVVVFGQASITTSISWPIAS